MANASRAMHQCNAGAPFFNCPGEHGCGRPVREIGTRVPAFARMTRGSDVRGRERRWEERSVGGGSGRHAARNGHARRRLHGGELRASHGARIAMASASCTMHQCPCGAPPFAVVLVRIGCRHRVMEMRTSVPAFARMTRGSDVRGRERRWEERSVGGGSGRHAARNGHARRHLHGGELRAADEACSAMASALCTMHQCTGGKHFCGCPGEDRLQSPRQGDRDCSSRLSGDDARE